MGLHIECAGDVVVLVPGGPLKGGKETDELETALRKVVDEGQKKILLDLAKSTILGNRPLGTLVSTHVSAAKHFFASSSVTSTGVPRMSWS